MKKYLCEVGKKNHQSCLLLKLIIVFCTKLYRKLAVSQTMFFLLLENGTYSRYGFIVGEFPSSGVTAGRTDRPPVRPCIVSGRVGEEERPSSGEKARIKAFLDGSISNST